MRILLLSNSYLPVLGGLQTVAHHLAKGLTRKGHTVLVVTNRYPRRLPRKEVLDGVPILRFLFLKLANTYLKEGRLDLFLASFWFHRATLIELNWLVKRFQPEIINLHYPLSQIPFLLSLQRRYPSRLVVSLHGDDILPWVRERRDNLPLKTILREATAVTACSRWLLEQAIGWEPAIGSKGFVIHNGIDLERFTDRCVYEHPKPYFFAFGRLTQQKGFDLLLESFAQLASQFPHIDLILAGEGEEQRALIEYTEQRGLGGRIHFVGRATAHEIVRLLNGCSFVVLPSRRETFGIAALEGLAAGKPILATNVGGLPELLNHSDSSALMVTPTVEGLTDGLREMLDNAGLQSVSREERNQTLSDLSWEAVIARYEEVYQRFGE